MTDVCLVLMPYAAIELPSIALGLLKVCLQKAQIKPVVLYPNLQFTQEIGLDLYTVISQRFTESLLGEWTFSGVLFPDFQPDHSEYFNFIASKYFPDIDLNKEVFWSVRRKAVSFVDRVAHSVLDLNPRLVGCSSTFQQHCASLALLKRIRELDPDVITFMGGANCEGSMGVATQREFPWVDYVISGEGDEVLPDFCRQLLETGRNVNPSKLPYGVIGSTHRTSQIAVKAVPRASVHHLDLVPIPDYDDYFQTLTTSKLAPYIQPGIPIETARGCWWGQKHQCTFCGLNGSGINYRSKSPDRVVEEFTHLSQRYGIRKFQVVDNILDVSHINTVLPTLATTTEPYTIFYETKANLKREQMQQLINAGVRCIQPGIESMHDSVLKLMNKGSTALMNVQLLKWAREFGIYVHWNMLAGFPRESDEWYIEMAEWLSLITHLQPPGGVSLIRYDRFSPYHERPADWELNLLPKPVYGYVYPFSREVLNELAYFFEDATDKLNTVSKKSSRPGLDKLKACVSQWDRCWQDRFSNPDHLPMLSMKDDGDRIIVSDTRPCASQNQVILEGFAYWVYKACDRALTSRELLAALHTQTNLDISWENIQAIVTELKKCKILLEINGRFLSLAVKEPYKPLLQHTEFPSGYVDINAYRRDRQRQRSILESWGFSGDKNYKKANNKGNNIENVRSEAKSISPKIPRASILP
jgi:ribosomal peptide maturation radical SAM protein 1